jgi:integrase
MPLPSRTGIRGYFVDADGRRRIDLRYIDAAGRKQRHQERFPDGTPARAAEQRAKDVLAAAINGTLVKRGTEAPLSLKSAGDKYLEWCKVNGAGDSKYKRRHVDRWLEVLGDMALENLSELAIERFKKARLDGAGDERPAVAAATVNRELVTMKHFLNRAVEWEWLPARPKIRLLKEPPGRVRSLSDDERAKLDAELPAGLKRVVLVAALSGQRLGNVIGMKKADVNFEHASISIPKTKSGKRHDVPISEFLAVVLREAFEASGESPYVFVSRFKKLKRPYTSSGVSSLFLKVVERAGLKDLHFHDLRHDFATRIRRAGHGLDVVQALLGHASPAMTQRYAHLGRAELHAAVEAVSGFAPEKTRVKRVVGRDASTLPSGGAKRRAKPSKTSHPRAGQRAS